MDNEEKEMLKPTRPTLLRTYVYRLTIEQDSMVHKICSKTGLSQNDVIKFILDDVLQTKPNLIFKMIETQIQEILKED